MNRAAQARHSEAMEKIANRIAGEIISKQVWLADKLNHWFRELKNPQRNLAFGGLVITVILLMIFSFTAPWNHFNYHRSKNPLNGHIGSPSGAIRQGKTINAIDTLTIKH